jgi:hypothetical protein
MRQALILFFFIFSSTVKAQPCNLLSQTFAIADTMRTRSDIPYTFRFSTGQLDDLEQLPGLAKAIQAMRKLQKTLDEDNASFQTGTLWQLDGQLAEKQLISLRTECPETRFLVFEREIKFYQARYKAKEQK